MKTELVQTLTNTFESHAQRADNGVEFWLARDIQHLLGYAKWDNFLNVVSKAKTACEVSGHPVADHFADVGKTIAMPKGAEKEVPDIMLTRYACLKPSACLPAENSRKPPPEQLPPMASSTRLSITTWMWCWSWGFGCVAGWRCVSSQISPQPAIYKGVPV